MLQQRLQGALLTVIGLAGLFGGVLFSIEAPRFTPVPVVFLTFWLVMVIVGKVLFTGLGKLRDAGVSAPAPQQVRAAAAAAGIVVAVGMMGFAATTAGTGTAVAAPCPGGGPATCGPDPGAPTLTFATPPAQTNAPGGQQGQQGGQDQQGIATSPAQGGDNGPGIQAQTPQFGTPGQQAPNIPGNEQPGQGQQGGQQPQGNGQGQQNQSPVQTTAPGGPQQTGQQQPGQTQSGQPSGPTMTVTKTESQCAVPGAGNGAAAGPGGNGGGASSNNRGGTGSDSDGEQKDGAPSWAYLVGEVTALMTGRRGRKAGPLNKDGSTPTNDTIPGDLVEGEDYKQWTTPDGDRTFILSENEDAPSKYRFNLDQPEGGSSKVNDDGSVSVFDRDGNQVKRFQAPWAYDTVTGQKIPTRYSVDGNDLVQTIDRPEGNNNPILADPDETVGIVDTAGQQEGVPWTQTMPNGETLTHTIVPGTGGQSVDTRAQRPDGSYSDIRSVQDGQGGWQVWSDNNDGSSSWAGKQGSDGGIDTQRYDGSPVDGQAPRVTSQANSDNSQGTITGTNSDGTQSTADYNRTQTSSTLRTSNPDGTSTTVQSEMQSDGTIETSQVPLAASQQSGSQMPPMPYYPKGSLDGPETRNYYTEGERRIAERVNAMREAGADDSKIARYAFDARNELRSKARDVMADRTAAAQLAANEPNKTWEQLIEDKMSRKNLTREQAIKDIARSASTSRASVNEALGVDPNNPKLPSQSEAIKRVTLPKLSRAASIGSKAAGPLTAAVEGYNAYQAYQSGEATKAEAIGQGVGATLGGIGGGAATGALLGSVVGPVGTVVGGIAGGIVGGIAGSGLGKKIGGWFD